jgi:hypothetical protein
MAAKMPSMNSAMASAINDGANAAPISEAPQPR